MGYFGFFLRLTWSYFALISAWLMAITLISKSFGDWNFPLYCFIPTAMWSFHSYAKKNRRLIVGKEKRILVGLGTLSFAIILSLLLGLYAISSDESILKAFIIVPIYGVIISVVLVFLSYLVNKKLRKTQPHWLPTPESNEH
ncbi:hypothetical protein CWI84_01950 [Idiomarina tyrosinivorans]|uniref:Uncharacterized protein n=1 Tax=Idiomarina tyrosinivorans TaxID=1445662 RepID=A0A432ZUH1_9GAMM|nr:hypothetical protein [Idiomarina tyrosinivorans]RUO81543.1 hypothetical protein CWI84_01950 [Idiomarina tyrosinivorans]